MIFGVRPDQERSQVIPGPGDRLSGREGQTETHSLSVRVAGLSTTCVKSENRSRLSMSRSLVSRFVLCFFLHRAFAFVVALGFVALHRVSIRTLMSCLEASSVPVGVRE